MGIDSADLEEDCGDEGGSVTIENALDGSNVWQHNTTETHYFVVDLGQIVNVQQVRGRSGGDLSRDPTIVNIYVSETNGNWGTAVNPAIITTWQDTVTWQEVALNAKNGRYVKVEITTTEDAATKLEFGGPTGGFYKIFDVYSAPIV